MPERSKLTEAILNLSTYHREHEKYYARAPLAQAQQLQEASGVLKTLADHWTRTAPRVRQALPMEGCEDLNETAAIQQSGVLFMEGEGEPPELRRLKRMVREMADDNEETGTWLSTAMEASWQVALGLIANPGLADVLGERHRIIANDWQAAQLNVLTARMLRRSLEILSRVDFTPAEVRADLAGPRVFPAYLYSAGELIDRVADLIGESANLVHDNERRWRVFRRRVEVTAGTDQIPTAESNSELPATR